MLKRVIEKPRTVSICLTVATLFVFQSGRLRAQQAPAGQPKTAALRVAKDDSTVSIFAGSKPLLVYSYNHVPKKPYVKQLWSPEGVGVLRDSPHDHKHHHALMFALAVDGVDFWSENPACGRQQHRRLGAVETTAQDGFARATFTQRLDWTRPDSDKTLICEQRTIEVWRGEGLQATLLSWCSRLQPPEGRESANLTGSHYFGLGLRFVQSMDAGGRFFNADDDPGRVVRGRERLVRSKWCAYRARAGDKSVTVALFDHPDNYRHPARIFTMSGPFAYLSATLNLWKEPLTVRAGEPLVLRYGVVLCDGRAEAPLIEKLYRRWTGKPVADRKPVWPRNLARR